MSRVRGDDEGRITLLALAFGLLATVLVLVVTSASAVHLQRRELYALSDAAARDAADALDEDRYYAGGGVLLTRASVRDSVAAYVGAHAPGAEVGAGTGTPDGRTARVELVRVTTPPFTAFVPAGLTRVRLVARSTAVADLR
ncbi:pilus assembly protein TadG-related protein [Kineococcus sp. LSe6-4]|uniref:Pilus assembly protein TadG-related protein n=1 Tax=Kineococcus halophytocola TaxID=3234027 RepID=A0ABV4H5B0_9ACTN